MLTSFVPDGVGEYHHAINVEARRKFMGKRLNRKFVGRRTDAARHGITDGDEAENLPSVADRTDNEDGGLEGWFAGRDVSVGGETSSRAHDALESDDKRSGRKFFG